MLRTPVRVGYPCPCRRAGRLRVPSLLCIALHRPAVARLSELGGHRRCTFVARSNRPIEAGEMIAPTPLRSRRVRGVERDVHSLWRQVHQGHRGYASGTSSHSAGAY